MAAFDACFVMCMVSDCLSLPRQLAAARCIITSPGPPSAPAASPPPSCVQEDQERVHAVLLSLSHACRLAKVDLPYDVLPTLLAAVFG